jgi:hypothetical protein
MSWDLVLNDPVTKEVIQFDEPHMIRGGTYPLEGTKEACLNITYNYGIWYNALFPECDGVGGIRILEGMTGAESIAVITSVIAQLQDDTDPDYWQPTQGNAKRALCGLLAFAYSRPDGVWHIIE